MCSDRDPGPLIRPTFWYELRVTLGLANLLPVLGLPAFALAYSLTWVAEGRTGQVDELRNVIEILLPLATGLAAAHLMTVEHEEGFDELRRSYPEPAWQAPLLRTAIGLGLSGMALLLGALVFRWTFGQPYPLAVVLLPIPPAIYLLGLSTFTGNLSRSAWVAAALVMAYWFFEIQTLGRVTQTLFLFEQALPLPGVSLLLNRVLLSGIGLLFLAANAWLSAARRRAEDGRKLLGFG